MKKSSNKLLIKGGFLSLIITALVLFFINFRNIFILRSIFNYNSLDLIMSLLNLKNFVIGVLFFLTSYILVYIIGKNYELVGEKIYRYRFLIGGVVLFLLVIFKVNGSSIGIWGNYIPNSVDDGLIFGVSRGIRSDEWALNTPMAISQFSNPDNYLPYFGDIFRGFQTDMFIIYGQPTFDLGVIFRPFHWGYLLLGMERGLSFFWYGRLIVLILVTFEFLQLITKKNRLLSLIGALLIAFAPLVTWWFAVNGLIEMLIFGQLAIIGIYKYLTTSKYRNRILWMLLVGFCGLVYILVFYPAWQVTLFYVFLALLIGILLFNKEKITFNWKKDIPIILGVILLAIVILMYVFNKSSDAIMATLNTVYPGERVEVGGYGWQALFRYPLSLNYPLKENGLLNNVSELATIFSFFPVGILLALWLIFKKKKRDPLLISLLVFLIFLSFFYLIGMPEILSKITLLSQAYYRSILGIGLLNLLILIRSITLMESFNRKISIIISVILTAFMLGINIFIEYSYFSKWMLPFTIIVLFLGFYGILRKEFKILLISVLLIVFSSLLVNPIRVGIDIIEENKFIEEITQLNSDKELWIVEGLDYPMNNVTTMAGVRTLNSTNVYPNLEIWEKIDENGKYEDIYNRYAHIRIDIVESETKFELGSPDSFKLYLNIDDINELGIEYILTTNDLEKLNTNKINFREIYRYGDYLIYKVN